MTPDRRPSTPVPGNPPAIDDTPATFVPGPGRHLSALDGLRGLAVLFVLIFHIFQFENEPGSGLPRLAYKVTRLGQTGVDLFFVLSGFLITGILQDTKGSNKYFRNFYGRRTVRIFPLYYGVLIVATIVLPLLLGHRVTDANPITLWTFTANMPSVFGVGPQTFGHFWTLAVEEQFYLIWPAVVFAFARPTMMKVCVACIVGSIFVRIGLVTIHLPPNSFMPGRLDSLALGGLLALAARGPEGMTNWRPRAWMTIVGMIAVVSPLYVIKTGSHEDWLQVVKFTLIAILYGAMLALAVTSAPTSLIGRFFNLRSLRFFGKYSYGIYVFHPFFLEAYLRAREADHSGAMETPTAVAVRTTVIIVLSIVSSWLSYHLFEKHFLRLKRYFEYGEGKPDPVREPAMAGGRGLAIEG